MARLSFKLDGTPANVETQIEKLYRLYPRHEGKAAGLKAIRRAIADVGYEVLLDGVLEYRRAVQQSGCVPEQCPHPSTWFNQRRWEDDRQHWWNRVGENQAEQTFDRLVRFMRRYGRNYPQVQGPERPDWLKAMRVMRSIGWPTFCDSYNERTRREWLDRFKRAWREAG